MTYNQGRIIEFFQSKHQVEGLTHNFYRYPARFAPEFAREVILEFSRKGDVVLDTFMGGGTDVIVKLFIRRNINFLDRKTQLI
jgi:DNA modification methylase